MIRTMDELLAAVAGEKRTVAVAAAHDADALRAVYAAHRAGIADAILIGDAEQIGRIAADSGIPIGAFQILHEPDNAGACEKAAALVREGAAGALMKGLVETAVILRAVLDREKGIRAAPLLSHVALLEISGFGRPLLLTDAAMNIAPDLEAKKQLLQNAALVARALGNPAPVAACLCASEKTNPKMPATLDAAALSEAARRGELPGCRVFGPAALDNAVFPEAAKHKGITDPLAGYADILLAPDIEAGNILYKALTLLSGAKAAGIVVGAKAPIILSSRADSAETKLHSIALALAAAELSAH